MRSLSRSLSAAEVAEALANHIEALCIELLPSGRHKSGYWSVGGTDNAPGTSMWVHLGDRAKRGHWQDAATGEYGDALDLLAACRYGGDLKAAYAGGLAWLGRIHDPDQRIIPARTVSNNDPNRAARKRAYARSVWQSAHQTVANTVVEDYLCFRGIQLRELTHQPATLRCHPRLFCSDTGRHYPAMVAAICDEKNEQMATHITWLDRNERDCWDKAKVHNPKKVYGGYATGSIRLSPGVSGKPLANAPKDEPIVLCEGIETGLSIALAVPELRVIATISLGNLGAVWLPVQVGTVIVAVEKDQNVAALNACQRALERHMEQGREVRFCYAPTGKDFNDTLRAWQ